MKTIHALSVVLALGIVGCGSRQLNVKFVEPGIAQYKAKGNRVSVGEGSLPGDLLAIEIMKNGKFILASRAATLEPKGDDKPAAPAKADSSAAKAADSPVGAKAAEAAPAAEVPHTGIAYIFRVNTITNFYHPSSNSYPATYSFSVTARTGEIIYVKALTGADLKAELASTVTEL